MRPKQYFYFLFLKIMVKTEPGWNINPETDWDFKIFDWFWLRFLKADWFSLAPKILSKPTKLNKLHPYFFFFFQIEEKMGLVLEIAYLPLSPSRWSTPLKLKLSIFFNGRFFLTNYYYFLLLLLFLLERHEGKFIQTLFSIHSFFFLTKQFFFFFFTSTLFHPQPNIYEET